MKTNIVSWGNSKALRIPKVYIDVLDWKVNDNLNMEVIDDKLTIEKTNKEKTIKELFKNYKGTYRPKEIDLGVPVGNEIW